VTVPSVRTSCSRLASLYVRMLASGSSYIIGTPTCFIATICLTEILLTFDPAVSKAVRCSPAYSCTYSSTLVSIGRPYLVRYQNSSHVRDEISSMKSS
jgi:hypothetical protein